MPEPKLLTLLTDFGDRDIYVGVMKGAIAQVNSAIRVVDLTHQVPPQDIVAGRFGLMNAFPYFPQGTVHLVVVDPGVGSQRRAIALELEQGFLVAPDNGIVSGVVERNQVLRAVELTNRRYWRTEIPSRTFHGRDIFATVAAHLASGVSLLDLGNEIDVNSLVSLDISLPRLTTDGVIGCIQYIDRFGNCISNIPDDIVNQETWLVRVNGKVIPSGKTYSDVEVGNAIALIGSDGWVEIAVNGGNAHQLLGLNFADTVEVKIY